MAGVTDIYITLQNLVNAASTIGNNIATAIAKGWAAGSVTGLDPSLTLSATNVLRVSPLAHSQATPSDPTGTTSLTAVMMGLNGALTPAVTGKVLLLASGTIYNFTGAGDGAVAKLHFGTGTAPANGAALVGTAIGGSVEYLATAANGSTPFSLNAVVTGLVVGTTYWIDIALAAIVGGTANIASVSLSAVELE